MPTPYPEEFRRVVIAVARKGDQSIAQVARSFGISESCLARWLKIADREDALAGSTASASSAGDGGDLEAAPPRPGGEVLDRAHFEHRRRRRARRGPGQPRSGSPATSGPRAFVPRSPACGHEAVAVELGNRRWRRDVRLVVSV